jgi:hypothetical protein
MIDVLATIRTLGDLLDDLERTRIANANRIAAVEREYGEGLPHLEVVSKSLAAVEHQAELELKRAWRRHPLAPWADEIKGCGEKLIARLVAVIGDPCVGYHGHWEVSEEAGGTKRRTWVVDEPFDRNPAKLWAYCGHGDPARAGQVPKGATQEELFKRGNPEAKKRVYLLASQFRRTPGSHYREVYDAAREKYAERVHAKPCIRCGPAGRPAPIGSPWSLGHQDAAALRYVGKVFLLDLWKAARATVVTPPKTDSPATPATEPTEPARAIHVTQPSERAPATKDTASTVETRAKALTLTNDRAPA